MAVVTWLRIMSVSSICLHTGTAVKRTNFNEKKEKFVSSNENLCCKVDYFELCEINCLLICKYRLAVYVETRENTHWNDDDCVETKYFFAIESAPEFNKRLHFAKRLLYLFLSALQLKWKCSFCDKQLCSELLIPNGCRSNDQFSKLLLSSYVIYQTHSELLAIYKFACYVYGIYIDFGAVNWISKCWKFVRFVCVAVVEIKKNTISFGEFL